MLVSTTPTLLLVADPTAHSHSVVMVSEIVEHSPELVSPHPKSTMKLVISSEDHPLATLQHVPTLVETEFLPTMNNVITEAELELNPTTEQSPTNAERDVSYLSVETESLILTNNAILEPAMD